VLSDALKSTAADQGLSKASAQHPGQGQATPRRRKYSILRFAIATLASYAAARFFADLLHFRLYVTHERIHIHHFVLGLVLMPITWLAFEEDRKPAAEVLAGAIAGLFLSEIKQLILEQWSP